MLCLPALSQSFVLQIPSYWISQHHRIFWVGRYPQGPQGSRSPTLKWKAQSPGFLWVSSTGTSEWFPKVCSAAGCSWPLKWAMEALQNTTACPGACRNSAIWTGWVFLGHQRQWPSLFAFGKVAMTPLLAGKLSSGHRLLPWLCQQLLLQLCPNCFPVSHHGGSIQGSCTPEELFSPNT